MAHPSKEADAQANAVVCCFLALVVLFGAIVLPLAIKLSGWAL